MLYTIGDRILGDRRRMLHTIRTFNRFSDAKHHASSWTTYGCVGATTPLIAAAAILF